MKTNTIELPLSRPNALKIIKSVPHNVQYMLSKDKLGILLGEVWVDIPIDYLREPAAMEEAFDQGWSKGYDDGYSQREEDEIFEAKN